LSEADLSEADFSFSKLSGADLSGADLSFSKLSGADLSGAKNLTNQVDYIKKNFRHSEQGLIVYKSFNEHYTNEKWKVAKNRIITENCNFSRTNGCGCGINFGTMEWCQKNCGKTIWKCLIKWEWLMGICVPYNTDGKCRCEKLKIISEV